MGIDRNCLSPEINIEDMKYFNAKSFNVGGSKITIESNRFYRLLYPYFFIKINNHYYPPGILHFLEHLVVEVVNKNSYLGIIPLQGLTTPLFTRYSACCLDESFIEIFDKILKVLLQPYTLPILYGDLFSYKHFINVKKMILQEYAEKKANSLDYLLTQFIYFIGNSSIYAPVIGDLNSIKATTLKDLKTCMDNIYNPSNLHIVILTSQKFSTIVDKIQQHIDSLRISTNHICTSYLKNIDKKINMDLIKIKRNLVAIYKNTEICYICIGFKTPKDVKISPLEGKIMLSPFLHPMVKSQIGCGVYSITPFEFIVENNGIIGITYSVAQNAIVDSLRNVGKIFFNIHKAGVMENSIGNLKTKYKLNLLNQLHDIDKRAAWLLYENHNEEITKQITILEKISISALNDKIKRLFEKENLYIGCLGPRNILCKTKEILDEEIFYK